MYTGFGRKRLLEVFLSVIEPGAGCPLGSEFGGSITKGLNRCGSYLVLGLTASKTLVSRADVGLFQCLLSAVWVGVASSRYLGGLPLGHRAGFWAGSAGFRSQPSWDGTELQGFFGVNS